MSGGGQGIFVNSAFSGGKTSTSDFTLYTSPYLVAQSGGRYTKHIYIGSQRIVSKLGDFDSYGADPRRIEKAGDSFNGVKVDYASKYKSALNVVKANYESLKVPYYGLDNDDYVNGLGFCCNPNPTTASTSPTGKSAASKNDNAELQQYYYHPDHLGSSSYISNLDGEVVQHVEYVPFGEVFLEEKNAVWNTPYLFNGKELDKETGMSYYGARYYSPKESIWISVDPEFAKFPGYSPYNYCLNNPVNLVDPDGMAPEKPKPPYYVMSFGSSRTAGEWRMIHNAEVLFDNVNDNAIRIYSHGNQNFIRTYDKDNNHIDLDTPNRINNYLSNSSGTKEQWSNIKKSGGTVISYACDSGDIGGIIQETSRAKENKNIVFVGPTEYTHPAKSGNGTVYSGLNEKEGGKWNIYKAGKLVATRPWDWQPTEINPKTYKDMPKQKSTTQNIIDWIKEKF